MFGLTAKAVFGIAVTLLALAMGAVFTYFNIAKSEGPRERKFVFRNCLVVWIVLSACMLLVVLLRSPYHYIPLGSLLILFPVLIYRMSIRHQLVRELERRQTALNGNGEKSEGE